MCHIKSQEHSKQLHEKAVEKSKSMNIPWSSVQAIINKHMEYITYAYLPQIKTAKTPTTSVKEFKASAATTQD